MPATVRRLEKGEEAAFIRSVRIPFLAPATGTPEDEAADRRRAEAMETNRTWVVEDGGQFVGNSFVRTMDLTVPSSPGQPCPIVRMGGVSAVGVHPTHRRRGFLSQMMARMLDDCRSRGEPFAGLIASESVIYGRYGFGLASDAAEYAVDAVRSAFTRPVPEVGIRLVETDEARKLLPDVWEQNRQVRPGEPNRTPEFWDEYFRDKPEARHGANAFFFAVCEDGYVSYRATTGGDPLRGERVGIIVEELWGTTPAVEAALWRFVLDLDLVGTVTFRRRAIDEPVRWRLKDPRQLQTVHIDDRIYIRILDVPETLKLRGYETEGRLVVDIQPAEVGEKDDPALGTWLLDAGPGGADCGPARGETPDLRLRVTDLGSLYLGGFKASTLAAAGLIEELTSGSLAAADRLFASSLAPLTVTGF